MNSRSTRSGRRGILAKTGITASPRPAETLGFPPPALFRSRSIPDNSKRRRRLCGFGPPAASGRLLHFAQMRSRRIPRERFVSLRTAQQEMDQRLRLATAAAVMLVGLGLALFFRRPSAETDLPIPVQSDPLVLRKQPDPRTFAVAESSPAASQPRPLPAAPTEPRRLIAYDRHADRSAGPAAGTAQELSRQRPAGQHAVGRLVERNAAGNGLRAARRTKSSTATRWPYWRSAISARPRGRWKSTRPIATCSRIRRSCPSAPS